MQIIHDPIQNLYVLLTNWGRIGEAGKHQQTPFTSRDKCVCEFEKVFRSKTSNKWTERESFKKVSKKYALVQRPRTRLKHPEKLLRAVVESPSHPCTLDPYLSSMLRALLDLSLETLESAEEKLVEIEKAIQKHSELPSDCSVTEILVALELIARLSSEFYELLPLYDDVITPFQRNDCRFGEAKTLIRQLRDLTITKQILLGGMHNQTTMNPIDYAYKALQIRIKPMMPDSIERRCLQRYIDNTCENDDVVIRQIYALDNGQPENEFDFSPNKRLLFHGSKNANIFGILKHGLLIAPPEASRT
eukprot:Pgem_evm1s172